MPELPEAAPGGNDRLFLTFRIGERHYALPAREVAEVIRVPAVARLPQGPKALMGLANLRGSVLPVVSLPAILARPAANNANAARAIILTGATSAALVVDAVDALVSPEASRVETRQAELAAEPGERLIGAFPIDGEAEVAKILDIQAVLSVQFGRYAESKRPLRSASASSALRNTAEARLDEQVLITFEVAGQEYGLPLESVQEIRAMPGTLAVVPRADTVLLGVIAHRDGLLPLLSFRALLGLPGAGTSSGREKVIVTPIGGVFVGLVADRMQAIIRADPALIEPIPSILAARTGGEARIKAIFRGDGGRRLISVLAPEQLFREDVMRRLGDPSGNAGHLATSERRIEAETIQFLVFRLGEEAFGLPIAAVDEVARAPDKFTRIPNAPEFLEGVINWRGEVLPVIDQRKRFGLPTHISRGGQRLVVVRTARHRAGLIVDSVSEVLRSSPGAIEPAPELIAGTNRLVTGVVNLESTGQMILLLDPDELLTQAEHGLLDNLASAATDQAGL
jgi:purine-binding chemotaxis protein CheW